MLKFYEQGDRIKLVYASASSRCYRRDRFALGKYQRLFVPQNDSFFDAVARAGILTF